MTTFEYCQRQKQEIEQPRGLMSGPGQGSSPRRPLQVSTPGVCLSRPLRLFVAGATPFGSCGHGRFRTSFDRFRRSVGVTSAGRIDHLGEPIDVDDEVVLRRVHPDAEAAGWSPDHGEALVPDRGQLCGLRKKPVALRGKLDDGRTRRQENAVDHPRTMRPDDQLRLLEERDLVFQRELLGCNGLDVERAQRFDALRLVQEPAMGALALLTNTLRPARNRRGARRQRLARIDEEMPVVAPSCRSAIATRRRSAVTARVSVFDAGMPRRSSAS